MTPLISPLEIYLISLGSSFIVLFALCTIGSLGVILGTLMFYGFEEVSKPTALKILKISVPMTVIFGLLGTVMPSTKTLALMYVVPKVATVENAEAVREEFAVLWGILKEELTDSSSSKKD